MAEDAKFIDQQVTWKPFEEIVDLQVSFETNEVLAHTLYFPYPVRIVSLKTIVVKAIAATDDATITAKNHAGTGLTGGVVTIAASSALATEDSASPTANNIIYEGQKLTLLSAKTTKGGRVRLTIGFVRYIP